MLATNIGTGEVVGQFGMGVVDGPDVDREPEVIPLSGQITFTPSIPYLPNQTATPNPITIVTAPIKGVLDEEGYLCTPDTDGVTPLYRGVRLFATDDPDGSVRNWTYSVTYRFNVVNGATPTVKAHSIAVPEGAVVDLTLRLEVPSSPGVGTPQALALLALAEAAATASADSAETAATVALQVKADADAGVFNGTPGAPGNPGEPGKDGSNVIPTDQAVAGNILDPQTETARALTGTIGAFDGNFGMPFTALLNPVTGAGYIMKPNGDKRQGVIGWQHAGESGYILHFETRPAAEGGKLGGAHIGIGLDYASPDGSKGVGGILISNKKRAVALTIVQGTGITHADAYGIDLQQASIAPAFHAVQNPGSGPIFQIQAGSGMGTSERILEIITANGTSGTIASKDGTINWREPVRLTGGRGMLHIQSNGTGLENGGDHLLTSAKKIDFRTYTGASGSWYPKRINSSGQTLSLEVASTPTHSGAFDSEPSTWLKAIEIRRGATEQARIGFFGGTPADKPSSVAITPEAIHAALVTLGLIGA